MLDIKNFIARYKFSPLYYNDGSPCYVRAGCLAACACCMLLSVALKNPEPNSDMAVSESNLALAAVDAPQGAGVSSDVSIGANGVISFQDSAAAYDDSGSLQHGAAARDAVQAAAAVSTQQQSETEGTLSPEMIAANSAAADAVYEAEADAEDDSWSFWAFFSGEAKLKKERLAHRKQALEELVNGAAFLTSCGNINAGYIGCRFDFSSKVNPYYDSKIEAADDGFMITLEAKGDQLKDSCTRFVVNSEGVYQAFDAKGHERHKCLLDSGLAEQMVSIHRAVDDLQGNPAPSGASLAQK